MKQICLLVTTAIVVLSTSPAQTRWQISASGGFLTPSFFGDNSSGYMIGGTLFYEISDSLQLSFSTGYHRWKENLGTGGTTFRTLPLLVGLRLPFQTGWISPYLSGELGVHYIKREYTRKNYELGERGLYKLVSTNPATESATRFAARFSAGVTLAVYNGLDLDVSATYDRIAYEFADSHPLGWVKGSLNLFGIMVGFKYEL